ncbi:MAG: sodium:proton antiporter [Bacteroidetes bacterium]|nr:sodium:proton antiporter [Bacteroidota bacterium]
MDLFTIAAALITLAAAFSYLNYRFIGLPTTIGVMLISLVMSLALIAMHSMGIYMGFHFEDLLRSIDFDQTVFRGMLAFLLFAGALHININDLSESKWIIGSLATVGVLISTVLVGAAMWLVLGLVGLSLPYIYCLLFGALISPTDPIAVLGILKSAGAPKSLETKISGESLFNDGVGVVVFIVVLELATGASEVNAASIAALFAQEAIGGALFGLGIGYLTYQMLKRVDNYQVELMITLATVMGGYALATSLHLSGLIAIVVAGLFVGNHGRLLGMSEKTRHHLDIFWELIDEILNAVLFVLMGLEVLVLTFTEQYLLAGLLLIPLVLLARFISVGIPVLALRRYHVFSPGAVRVMTWGGLRGGISVALALSLPAGPERGLIIAVTYIIVVFSILVQGLTLGRVIKRLSGSSDQST